MPDRFGRDFELVVRVGTKDVIINPPFRVVFDGTDSESGGLNKIQIQLYNLPERKRLLLVKDREGPAIIPVSFSVGYENNLQLLFKGAIDVGQNERQGPDIITTIGCKDGLDTLDAFTARTVKGGQTAVNALIEDMPVTTAGKITERPVLTRPKVLVGNSLLLIEETIGPGESLFIKDEKLYILKSNEVLGRFTPLVNAATGLISTPTREANIVTFQTLMNPSIKIGKLAQLQSVTAPHLDGIYKIRDINYSGDNYGDDWSMSCTGLLSSDWVTL